MTEEGLKALAGTKEPEDGPADIMIKPEVWDDNSVSFTREDGVTIYIGMDTFDGPGTLRIHAVSPERHSALRFELDTMNEASVEVELGERRRTDPSPIRKRPDTA